MNKKLLLIKGLIACFLIACWFLPFYIFAGSQITSGLTLDDIITAARYKLGAVSASAVEDPLYSDTELIRWVNDGLIDITKKTGCYQTTEAENLIANTIEYALAAYYYNVVGVIFTKSDGKKVGLKKGNIWSVGQTQSDFKPAAQRQPEFWYEFDGKIGVYPPLSTISGTTETITAYLSIIPARLTSTSSAIPTPAQFDKALILYVTAQGHKKVGNVNAYKAAMEEYMMELGLDKTTESQSEKEQEVTE